MTIALTIPYPPLSGNHQYLSGGKGRRRLDPRIESWRTQVFVAAHEAGARNRATGCRLLVTAVMHMPDRRERDVDNAWKVVADALQFARVIENDAHIDRLLLVRGEVSQGNPRVAIKVRLR